MGLEQNGLVEFVGQLAVGDVHALHGNQLQPSYVWVDHMGGTFMDALAQNDGTRLDRIVGIAHAAPYFVPFHQLIPATLPTDGGVYATGLPAIPCVEWTKTVVGTVTPEVVAYGDRYFGNEYFECNMPSNLALADIGNISMLFESVNWRTPAGTVTAWNEQGFTLFFQKQRFGASATATAQSFSVKWRVSNMDFQMLVTQGAPPEIYMGTRNVRSAMSWGGSPVGMVGSVPSTDLSQNQFIQVMLIGGRMQINMTGLPMPIVIHLERLWHASVTRIYNGYINIPKDAADRFPPVPFTAKRWPAGQSPTASNTTSLSVTAKVNASGTNQYDSLLSGTVITADSEIGILEPRISRVSVEYNGMSQVSFSVHPLRFRNSFSYTSVQQQLGFTPNVSTPARFDIHLSGDVAKNKLTGNTFVPAYFPNHTITITDEHLANSQISQYSIDCSSAETPISYANVATVRYTPGIERVSIRYDGITQFTEPVEGDYNVIDLGSGQNNAAEYLRAVQEDVSFNFQTMRIQHELSATWNNFDGIQVFANRTGIRGTGNVAMAFRWGYAHSLGVAGEESASWWNPAVNGPGWARFYGYCDTYAYSGQAGMHTLTMAGSSMISRIDDTIFHAPPNVDGWNHYRAVYTLLSMAGIPDDRIGFKTTDSGTNMVPTDPYGVTPADPDYATGGFFLPIGVGSNPWTPIARGMTAGQLIAMIQQVTAYVLFVDSMGVWQYKPFMQDASGLPVRVFRETYPYDSNHGLTSMWNIQVTYSTSDVRNEVVILGIDAYNPVAFLDPIYIGKRDELSINAAPGFQPVNYVGWKKNFAMVDSRFATHDFAEKTAARIFAMMRQPSITVQFTCWGQPDIYPMDFIAVEYPRSGISGFPASLGVGSDNTIPLYVTNVNTTIERNASGLIPVSRITAKYIPLDGYAEIGAAVNGSQATSLGSSRSTFNVTQDSQTIVANEHAP